MSETYKTENGYEYSGPDGDGEVTVDTCRAQFSMEIYLKRTDLENMLALFGNNNAVEIEQDRSKRCSVFMCGRTADWIERELFWPNDAPADEMRERACDRCYQRKSADVRRSYERIAK